MEIRNRICKFCLEKCEIYKFFEGNTKDFVEKVLTKIEYTIIQEPVICKNCEEMLISCFDFKTTCLNTYNYLVPFVNDKHSKTLNLKDVYLNKNSTASDVSEDQNICSFCISLVKCCYAVSIDVEEGGVLKKMIEQCLPELDLSFIKKPVICVDCHRSLENCFRFVTNCLTAEEKIKKYCEGLDVSSRGLIELSGLLYSTMETIEAIDIDGNSVDIKAKKEFSVKIENPEERGIGGVGDTIKLERISCDNSEYVNEIENKNESFTTWDNLKVNNEQQFMPKNISAACVDEDNELGIKREDTFFAENQTSPEAGNIAEMDDQKFIINKEIDIKTDEYDFNRSEEGIVMAQNRVNTNPEDDSIKQHIKQTMIKKDMKETAYQCAYCPFQTKIRRCLIRHLFIHKAPTEVTMFKCEFCSFQSRRKFNLKKHMFRHSKSTTVKMFNCDFCSYQTTYKDGLNRHLLTHNATSDIIMFKCELCPFQAKWKSTIKKHMLNHVDSSELTMFSCDICTYQSKYKGYLKQHLISHKASSEITMFKCYSCPFQTRWKRTLENHILTHMDPSELKMFTCDVCSYETKYKNALKQHLITHKAPSELRMFKCVSCPFQSRLKHSLKHHMLKHTDSSELTKFSCDFCSFQSKYKNSLKQHLITHRAASETTVFKCDSCQFQTKHKHNLKYHMLKHMDPSKVTMFSCELCPYQAKYKAGLTHHLVRHEAPIEITTFKCDS